MYANYWTNSVCSHPLYNEEEINDCKLSVKRRAEFELNV